MNLRKAKVDFDSQSGKNPKKGFSSRGFEVDK